MSLFYTIVAVIASVVWMAEWFTTGVAPEVGKTAFILAAIALSKIERMEGD